MKFTEFNIKELESIGCENVTPYSGNKGNTYFKIDTKNKNIILDKYIMKNDKLISIVTLDIKNIDVLIQFLKQ